MTKAKKYQKVGVVNIIGDFSSYKKNSSMRIKKENQKRESKKQVQI